VGDGNHEDFDMCVRDAGEVPPRAVLRTLDAQPRVNPQRNLRLSGWIRSDFLGAFAAAEYI
jgi:hypothetical protein